MRAATTMILCLACSVALATCSNNRSNEASDAWDGDGVDGDGIDKPCDPKQKSCCCYGGDRAEDRVCIDGTWTCPSLTLYEGALCTNPKGPCNCGFPCHIDAEESGAADVDATSAATDATQTDVGS